MRRITKYSRNLILIGGVLLCVYTGVYEIKFLEANEIQNIKEVDLVVDAQETNDEFVKKPGELSYLFAAFCITWIVLFAYIYIIARNRKEIESELRNLKNSLEKNDHS